MLHDPDCSSWTSPPRASIRSAGRSSGGLIAAPPPAGPECSSRRARPTRPSEPPPSWCSRVAAPSRPRRASARARPRLPPRRPAACPRRPPRRRSPSGRRAAPRRRQNGGRRPDTHRWPRPPGPHRSPPPHGVTCRFGRFIAVDAVDLEVGAGEVVGLLGANGAGKTTLIRMLLGLLRPSEGRVELFGRPPSRATRAAPRLRPARARPLGGPHGRREPAIRRTIVLGRAQPASDAELAGLAGTLVRDLPLGLRRRLAFAAALAHAPELLVLDEPTSGVDRERPAAASGPPSTRPPGRRRRPRDDPPHGGGRRSATGSSSWPPVASSLRDQSRPSSPAERRWPSRRRPGRQPSRRSRTRDWRRRWSATLARPRRRAGQRARGARGTRR